MNKINGYTEEEAQELITYVEEGKKRGKTLTSLFASYGQEHGRARGSVRNYYYALMKNNRGDERIVKLLDGRQLTVGKIRAFSAAEADEAIRSILLERAKGVSIRRAIFNLSGGDDKLMLRLQNKYRNTLKKNPQRIAEIAMELGLNEEAESVKKSANTARKTVSDRDFLRRRLENEINSLYDRLTQALKVENERLRAENALLKAENERLKSV